LVEQVTNCIQSPFARSEKQRSTAASLIIDLGPDHLQQTHAAHVAVSRRAGEVRLTARTSARQEIKYRDREQQRARKSDHP